MITENIYTSNDGTQWSMVTDWMNIPAERVIPADLAVTRASMGLNNDRLIQAFREIKEDLNSGQIVEAYSKFDQLERRVADIPDESLLQDIACVFALLPNEKPDVYDPELNRIKLQIWAQDEKCRFFFIVKAVRYIIDLSDISDVAIHTAMAVRNLTELKNPNKNIFPLALTGLMNTSTVSEI